MRKRRVRLVVGIVAVVFLVISLLYWYYEYGYLGFIFGITAYIIVFSIAAGWYLQKKYPRVKRIEPQRKGSTTIIIHNAPVYEKERADMVDAINFYSDAVRETSKYGRRVEKAVGSLDIWDNWGYLSKRKKRKRRR